MKKLLILIISFLIPVCVFAQVRKQVCIVRPNYSDEIKEELKDFIPRLKKLELENPEEYIENFIEKGSSGSGFIYVDEKGNNYVITNRHVIADAKTCNVVFYKDKGKNVVYRDLKIFAANADLDLAILVFPDNKKPFDSGLEFADDELQDGSTVYTAGYPGLLGNPSWQFGSGFVTNESVEVEELIKPGLSTVIQHSAQIDAGNSGGPLLVKVSEDSYKVAGINTWKIINRQDTNFAIPAKTIKKFIKDSISGKDQINDNPGEAIKENAIQLQKVLNKFNVTFEEVSSFISINYIENEGKAIFDNAIKHCDDNNRKTMNEILKKYSPIEGMRYAIGWYIFHEYHKYEYKMSKEQKSTVEESKLPDILPAEQLDGSDIWATLLYNKSSNRCAKTEWIYTNGGWELCSLENVNATADIKKSNKELKQGRVIPEGKGIKIGKVTFYNPSKFAVSYSLSAPVYNLEDIIWSHLVNIDFSVIDIFALTLGATVMEPKYVIYNYGTTEYIPLQNVYPLLGAQFQLPLTGNHLMFMPYLGVKGGVKLSNFQKDITTDIIGAGNIGARLNFFFGSSNTSFFFDCNSSILLKINDFDIDNILVNIGAGVAF